MPDPYISEVLYRAAGSDDFIEIAVDAGSSVSGIFVTIYNPNGSIRSVSSLGAPVGSGPGVDIYVLEAATSSTFNGINRNGAIALEQNGVLLSFIGFDDDPSPLTANGGIADGQQPSQVGSATSGQSLESTDGGANYTLQTTPGPGGVPCFVAGTRIATPKGCVLIETLRAGDAVLCADGRVARVKAALSRHVQVSEMAQEPRLRPVRIVAGALAPGLPKRDLRVSRQHRMVACSRVATRVTGARSVLVPAVRLVGLKGVRIEMPAQPVDYIHLVFDTHEIVLVEGVQSESLLLGPQALRALSAEALAELRLVFPDLFSCPMHPALPIPSPARQCDLIKRLRRNGHPVQEGAITSHDSRPRHTARAK